MKSLKMFLVEGNVRRYPGEGGWHFVYVPEKLSRQIRDNAKAYSNGLVRIRAAIGKTSWATTLFPTKDGPYLIAIRANIRAKENVADGDKVKITCSLL